MVFEQNSLVKGYNDFLPYAKEISGTGELFVKNATQNIEKPPEIIGKISDDFVAVTANYKDAIKLSSHVFENYGQWLRGQISEAWLKNIVR